MLQDGYDRAEIGKRIKQLRKAQEKSVQDLATKSGVSAGYISEVERGLPAVSVDKLTQIAQGLGVSVDVLMGKKTDSVGSPDVVQIPAPLSELADRLNLSHRATLTLLRGQQSLTARRSRADEGEWGVDDWMKFYEQVKDYLPDC